MPLSKPHNLFGIAKKVVSLVLLLFFTTTLLLSFLILFLSSQTSMFDYIIYQRTVSGTGFSKGRVFDSLWERTKGETPEYLVGKYLDCDENTNSEDLVKSRCRVLLRRKE